MLRNNIDAISPPFTPAMGASDDDGGGGAGVDRVVFHRELSMAFTNFSFLLPQHTAEEAGTKKKKWGWKTFVKAFKSIIFRCRADSTAGLGEILGETAKLRRFLPSVFGNVFEFFTLYATTSYVDGAFVSAPAE